MLRGRQSSYPNHTCTVIHHGMPLQHLLSNHMQSTSMGGADKALFCRNIMEACEAREFGSESMRKHQLEGAIMQAKECKRTFGRCTRSRSNKHECTREEPSQEEERGKSLIQLFVRVLYFVGRDHLRLSIPPRLFRATNHILNPLKVQTPK
jgi:hypothetical protein